MRPVQEPTIEVRTEPKGLEGTRESHPAFGTIGASRVTGDAVLFGSDFVHHNFIMIRIGGATLDRSLSSDWIHGDERHIEVALSEAQWATFVSTLNVGTGTPCTITRLGNEQIPELPDPKSRQDQFKAELLEHLEEAMAMLDRLHAQVGTATSVTGRADLLKQIGLIKQQLRSNTPFVAKQFGEHVEKVTEHAKIELNAYLTNLVQRTGLQALADGQRPFELPAAITAEGGDK